MTKPRIITDEEQIAHVERVFAEGAAIWGMSISPDGASTIDFIRGGEKVTWSCGAAAAIRANELMDEQSTAHLSKAMLGSAND